jgi:hypothetical protein
MHKRFRLAALGLAAIAVVLVSGGAGAQVSDEAVDFHVNHRVAGATIAYPVAEDVRHVGGDNFSTGGHVAAEGNRLYVGAYGLGMRIFDISDREKPKLIGQYTPGDRADAVPDAAVFDGRHIAVLNGTRRVGGTNETRTDKSEFLDVTDPANPRLLWTFIGQTDGEAHNGDIADARRWWLPSGGTGVNGLRIYDLNPLLGATPAAPANLSRANPVTLWESSPYRQGRPVGAAFTHTHDVTVYLDYQVRQPDGSYAPRDIALLAEGGNYLNDAGDTGSAFVIDITDPLNPVVLNRWLHEKGPDHHPIRYHHEAQFLDGDPHVMLVTDEDLHNGCGRAGGSTAVRVSQDLTRVTEELSEWFIPAGTPAAVCSVHVFSSQGDLVFFGSYNAGLQVVDYGDPRNPQRAAYYIAPGTTAWGALVLGRYIYVGDMSRGLDVYTLDDPELLLKLKLKLPK